MVICNNLLLNPYYIKSNFLALAKYFPLIIPLNLNGLKLWAKGDNNPTPFSILSFLS